MKKKLISGLVAVLALAALTGLYSAVQARGEKRGCKKALTKLLQMQFGPILPESISEQLNKVCDSIIKESQ